jgi:hypothetical protein
MLRGSLLQTVMVLLLAAFVVVGSALTYAAFEWNSHSRVGPYPDGQTSTAAPSPSTVGSTFPSNVSPGPTIQGLPTVSAQDEIQTKYDAAREALRGGYAFVPQAGRVKLGETYTLRARVCGQLNVDCSALATVQTNQKTASAAPAASPEQVKPLNVRARIGATVTSSEGAEITPSSAEITPSSEDVQYLGESDSILWEWEIKPKASGESFLTIRFRVLFGDTQESLVGDTILKIPLIVGNTPGGFVKQAGRNVLGAIVWIVGVVGGLGVTAGAIAARLGRPRKERRKARESWERKRRLLRHIRKERQSDEAKKHYHDQYRRPGERHDRV